MRLNPLDFTSHLETSFKAPTGGTISYIYITEKFFPCLRKLGSRNRISHDMAALDQLRLRTLLKAPSVAVLDPPTS